MTDFAYPTVATLVTVWTDLEVFSDNASNQPKAFDTYVETALPIKERQCTLRPTTVQNVQTGVSPQSTFNSYAASTPYGWTAATPPTRCGCPTAGSSGCSPTRGSDLSTPTAPASPPRR